MQRLTEAASAGTRSSEPGICSNGPSSGRQRFLPTHKGIFHNQITAQSESLARLNEKQRRYFSDEARRAFRKRLLKQRSPLQIDLISFCGGQGNLLGFFRELCAYARWDFYGCRQHVRSSVHTESVYQCFLWRMPSVAGSAGISRISVAFIGVFFFFKYRTGGHPIRLIRIVVVKSCYRKMINNRRCSYQPEVSAIYSTYLPIKACPQVFYSSTNYYTLNCICIFFFYYVLNYATPNQDFYQLP